MIRRLAAGVGANIFDKATVAVAQLALMPMFLHAWGLEVYGLWSMLAAIPMFLAMGDFGFATAAGVRMTIAEARGEREIAICIFQSAWVAIQCSSVVLVMAACVAAWSIPVGWLGANTSLSEPALRLTVLLLMLYGIAIIQGSIFFAGFRAGGDYATGAFWNTMIIIIESTAVMTALALGAGPPVAAAAFLGGRVVGLVGQSLLLRRRVPWLPLGITHADGSVLRSLIAPAGAIMLVPLAQACLLQGTALALGMVAGKAVVPVFTAVRTLSRIGLQACWTVNAAMMPEFSAAIGRDDRDGIAGMVFVTLALSLGLILPFAAGFGVFGKWAVALWSNHVIIPGPALIWTVAVGIALNGLWFPLSNLLLAADRQQTYTGIYAALAVATVPAAFMLARHHGAAGASLAVAASDAVMVVVVVRLARRHLAAGRVVLRAGVRVGLRLRHLATRFQGRRA